MNQIDDPVKRVVAEVVDKLTFVFYLCLKLGGKKTPYKTALEKLNFKKILVIRLDHIGDVLITTPIYKALRQRYPEAQIDTMIGSWGKGVLEHNRDVNRRIIYDAPWWREVRSDQTEGGFRGFRGFRELWNMIARLRREKYDLVIDPRADFRQIFFFGYLAGASHILSFDRSGGSYFLSQALPFHPRVHEMEKNADLLSALGITSVDRICRTVISAKEEQFVETFIRENHLTGKDILVVSPGARKALKLWPLERFSELTLWLLDSYPRGVVIFVGGAGEARISQVLDQTWNGNARVFNLIGKTNLLQTFALLKRSRLVITHDGPVSHMASELNVPTAVLFGPTDVERFKPLREGIKIVFKPYACSPCLLKICCLTHSASKAECMEAISVEDMKEAVGSFLNRHQ